MANVHFMLQGKGGVGKSFIASVIAQYLLKHAYQVTCIDTDPVVPTSTENRPVNTAVRYLIRAAN